MDRLGAARDRVRMVEQELHGPAVTLPCIKCRYYELVCTHPAVVQIKANPETGKVKLKPVFAEDARSEAGACGPEGALFDGRSLPAALLVEVLANPSGRWILGSAVVILLCGIFGY